MKSEIEFLLDLFLNQRLQKSTKDLIAERLTFLAQGVSAYGTTSKPHPLPAAASNQAPSMQAIMARNPDIAPEPQKIPIEHVAQNPVTQAALASRAQSIAAGENRVIDKVSGRPKKW